MFWKCLTLRVTFASFALLYQPLAGPPRVKLPLPAPLQNWAPNRQIVMLRQIFYHPERGNRETVKANGHSPASISPSDSKSHQWSITVEGNAVERLGSRKVNDKPKVTNYLVPMHSLWKSSEMFWLSWKWNPRASLSRSSCCSHINQCTGWFWHILITNSFPQHRSQIFTNPANP